MESVQDWRNTERAATEDADHLRAIDAVASLLEGEASPAQAAEVITTTYESSLLETFGRPWELKTDDKVSYFWAGYMSGAARTFGSAQSRERLVNLLVEISKRPDLEDADGFVITGINVDGVYWRDLPAWGRNFTSDGLYYRHTQEFTHEHRGDYLAQGREFLNATSFAAVLLERGECAFVLPLEASITLQMGLEHSYDEGSYEVGRVEADDAPILIPAAAIWLLIAGRTIYDHCLGDETDDGWHMGTWDRQRWERWKTQLGEFAESDDFNEECRDVAAQAVAKMLEIEMEHHG